MVSTAKASSSRPFILRKGIATLADLADGGGAFGYPGDYPGRIYYVNNINGLSTNDGLSWDTAFDQVSTAVTASETFRALPSGSTNDYIRNIIYVQGTGTAYTKLTSLPSYCDIIGIGADPRGNGAGIAQITGSTSAAIAGASRGLRLYNLQFTGSGSYYAAAFTVLFRSWFENCTFVNSDTGGLDITTGGGYVVKNCQIGCGDTSFSVTGMRVGTGGTNFNNCLIEDCVIYGSTTGFLNAGYLCNGTVIRNNVIMGGTTGVDDNSTHTTIGVLPMYVGNYIWGGSDAMSMSNGSGANTLGNWVSNAGVAAIEETITDITT